MQATVETFRPDTRSGTVLSDGGQRLAFDAAAFDAGGLRLLRLGQRVNLDLDADRVLAITLGTLPLPARQPE